MKSIRDITIEEFKNLMVTKILGIDDIKEAKRYELTDADWEAIDELADKKYKSWDWNYGKSPKYEYNRSERLSSGTVDITISVEQNRIADCRIYGDFFGQGDIKDVEEALQGTKMTREDLTHQLKQLANRSLFWQCYGRSISGYDFKLILLFYVC